MFLKLFFVLPLLIVFQAHAQTEQVSLNGTLSPWLEIEIGNETQSFVIGLESENPQYLYVADLIDPNGKVYIKSNHLEPSAQRLPPHLYASLNSPNRITMTTKGLGSALIPNGPESKIVPGVWKMRLAAQAPVQTISYTVFEALQSQTLKTLQLPLFIPATMPLIDVQGLVLALEELFAQHTMAIELQIHRSKPHTTLPLQLDEWVMQLQNSSSTQARLHLLENDQLAYQKSIQGFAGCLPVFNTQITQRHCALAVVINPLNPPSFEQKLKVLTHEIGHFLGLYHLVDDYYPFGRLRSTLVDHQGQTQLNIMHETSEFFGDLIFSDKQVEVMKRHPLFYQ